ncbi:MAG: hypothetical protein ACO2O2_16295 [Acidilobaceae archaeon]
MCSLSDRVRTRYGDAEDLAVKTLVLALQLIGVGKGSRRGLGSLDLTNVLIPRIRLPSKLRDLLDEVHGEAVDVVRRYARECSKTIIRSCDKRSLPPIPVISKLTSKAIGMEANADFNITSVHLIQGPSRGSQFHAPLGRVAMVGFRPLLHQLKEYGGPWPDRG